MREYKHVVGIDLGTTNTLACYLKGGRPELIKFPGGKMLPSVLYVDEDGKILIGSKAKRRGKLEPGAMARSSKTWIGDNEAKKTWTLRGQTFTPTDVATEILKEVRKNYIKQVKCDENEEIGAVITIPAYFNSNQTDETRKALLAAGFKLLQIITEPMAAAVAAVRGLNLENKKVLVVDIGGGTFDLSVLEADDAENTYNAIDIGGDARLGGDDVDELLSRWLMDIIHDQTGVDFSSLEKSALPEETYYSKLAEIHDAMEEAKKELSEASEADISLPHFLPDYDVDICLDRQEFESICQPFFDRVKAKLGEFLDNGEKFAKEELGGTILAGGSCYIPRIQDDVESFNVPDANSELDRSILVAVGAAHIAKWINGGMNVKVKDILSHSLGIEVLEDNQDVFSPLLKKGREYPCSESSTYTTVMDNQEQIVLRVYEAGNNEREKGIDKHKFYGSMLLEGIEIAPRGVPEIEVKFEYDKSRCLLVTARDKKTGAKQALKIMKGEHHESAAREAPMDFMLLMDISSSMESSLNSAKDASLTLINNMIDLTRHRLGLIAFNHNSVLLSSLTTDTMLLEEKMKSLRATGGTDMGIALRTAEPEMRDPQRKKIIILVTDGRDLSERRTLETAREMKADGFRIIAIGVGSEVDANFLRNMASPNDFYTIQSMNELKETFEQVIAGLAKK